jgi:hypothetical protein
MSKRGATTTSTRRGKGLAPDVHVTASTTMTGAPPTDLTGVDDYMNGLTQFAHAVVPGSARILESVGDECNALILVTVEADFGGTKTTLPACATLSARREQQDQV